MRKSALSIVLAAVLTVTAIHPAAASSVIDDANRVKNDANSSLSETNRQITEIENEQASLQKKIDALDSDLVALLIDIDVLEDEIVAKQDDIRRAEADLEDAQAREAKQYEDMKLRIRYMYEHSKTSYIQSILESKSITDLLNRVSYFNDVYDYDRAQLVAYQDTVQQVADYKLQLEQEEADMEDLLDNYNQEKETLEAMLDEKRATMVDFDNQLASAQQLAAQYKATIDEQNRIIAAEEARIAEEKRKEEERRRKEEEERKKREELARQERERQKEEERRRQEEAERLAALAAQQSESPSEGESTVPDTTSGETAAASSEPAGDAGLNPAQTTNISGADVVAYAQQFIGNPYVYGGTSLTNGCDCSGFTMRVFEHFGISLPRTSYEQRSAGNAVSYANAQPGDLICYSGHVAIYIGGGRIVGAQSTRSGITTATATYRTILSVRRVI